jgi:GGDEF domain-containing protein
MVSVTASIGISLYPRDGTTPEALISRADAAMYVAKRSGAVHAFSPAEAPVAKP